MIRRATEQDLPGIGALLRQVNDVHAAGRPDLFIPGCRKYNDGELRGLLSDDRYAIFVYIDEEDGGVWGHAFCELQETPGGGNLLPVKTLYIDDICVDEAHRGRHIATRLYEHAHAFALETGRDRVTLHVWAFNTAARALYESVGMKPMKTLMEEKL